MFYKKYIFNDAVINYLIDKTTEDENGCWVYPGSGKNPPSFKIDSDRYSVKLAIYVTFFPDEFVNWNPEVTNMQTDSTCGNVKCVNPHHNFVRGTEKFFWHNVDIGGENECWPWKGKARMGRGYAGHCVNGYRNQEYVHRLAYKFGYDKEIDSEVIGHSCNIKICCNPAHLEEQTHAQNIVNAHADGLHSSITLETATAIKYAILDTELTYDDLAARFDVHYNVITNIVSLKTWNKHGMDILPDGRSFSAEINKRRILGPDEYMILYVLQNKITDKVYVGITSSSLDHRLQAHKTRFDAGNHTAKMQPDYDKYGWDSFELIYEIQISNCNWKDAEIALIHQYRDAGYELYNTEHIGGSDE